MSELGPASALAENAPKVVFFSSAEPLQPQPFVQENAEPAQRFHPPFTDPEQSDPKPDPHTKQRETEGGKREPQSPEREKKKTPA